ncbi:hypothetical protein QR680_002106 [Steinernema hermaphroditum]|uniref:Uncharacterized protein n=1 Tax=Steinernema hermaphroditum TaxID=289476 RepID=A0AA39H1A6_9BILA|nr:hypothetical protein QR680_002106 [Steinernema hermaphroditum]
MVHEELYSDKSILNTQEEKPKEHECPATKTETSLVVREQLCFCIIRVDHKWRQAPYNGDCLTTWGVNHPWSRCANIRLLFYN